MSETTTNQEQPNESTTSTTEAPVDSTPESTTTTEAPAEDNPETTTSTTAGESSPPPTIIDAIQIVKNEDGTLTHTDEPGSIEPQASDPVPQPDATPESTSTTSLPITEIEGQPIAGVGVPKEIPGQSEFAPVKAGAFTAVVLGGAALATKIFHRNKQ